MFFPLSPLTKNLYFDNSRNIETSAASQSFAALAHPVRLEVFRRLIGASPETLSAGQLALDLAIPPNTLSFHLKELSHADLISSQREGRSILYSVSPHSVRELLSFLTEDCCQGRPELCQPAPKSCC